MSDAVPEVAPLVPHAAFTLSAASRCIIRKKLVTSCDLSSASYLPLMAKSKKEAEPLVKELPGVRRGLH